MLALLCPLAFPACNTVSGGGVGRCSETNAGETASMWSGRSTRDTQEEVQETQGEGLQDAGSSPFVAVSV